jgi:Holliday junction resolvasome RuvABC endonuclease subunit
MKIIALDLGTTTGWCAGETRHINSVPVWGCFKLAGAKDLNDSFIGLHNEISDLLQAHEPSYVVYESPLTRSGRDSSRNVVDLLVGLAAIARLTGTLEGIPVFEQSFAEVRKRVIGRGSFPKPFRGTGKLNPKTGKMMGDAKEEVQIWIEQYGWGQINQADARDAAVLYRYAQIISPNRQFHIQTGSADAATGSGLPVLQATPPNAE